MISKIIIDKVLFVKSETSRLYIRSYSEIDYHSSISLYSDPILTQFFDHGKPRNKEEIDTYLVERGSHAVETGVPLGLFSVFLKDSNIFIGQIDAVPTEKPGEVEIGWIFLKEFQNFGYCSEAINYFLIPFIKELSGKGIQLKGSLINRIIATAHPENLASNKIMSKVGLTLYTKALRFGGNPRNWYELNLGNYYEK